MFISQKARQSISGRIKSMNALAGIFLHMLAKGRGMPGMKASYHYQAKTKLITHYEEVLGRGT
jgi:hypothetical protein